VTVKFVFEKGKMGIEGASDKDGKRTGARTIFEGLKNATEQLPHWELSTFNDAQGRYDLEAFCYTPKCGWIDQVDFTIDEEKEAIIVVGSSRSTNICPGWCCFRPCCCCKCFGDSGQNQKHLQVTQLIS